MNYSLKASMSTLALFAFGSPALAASAASATNSVAATAPIPDCSCCDDGKPVVLTMRYLASDCSATNHTQDPSKVSCSGDPMGDLEVYIRATDNDDPNASGALVWFEGVVLYGNTFDIDARNAMESKLKAETHVYVYDAAGGTLLQAIEFHTSCSHPLEVGNQFGSVLLHNCIGEDSIAGDLCDDGRPRLLTLEYTGDDCSATTHTQDPSKVNCSGDPMGAVEVFILATNNSNPTASGVNIWYQGSVPLGAQFDLSAANANGTRLDAETHVHVFDATGATLLQSIEFHTSCSQPLEVGNQFGSVEVIAAIGENAGDPGNACGEGRPRLLTMLYTGEDCSVSTYAQSSSSFACSGDPMGLSPARIRVSDNSNPAAGSARVFHDATVEVGELYYADAIAAGADELGHATFIHVFDAAGNVIQQVQFESHCHGELLVGDNFGGHIIVGAVGREEADAGCSYCIANRGDCPCGNEDPDGGCANSTGLGAKLRTRGTASVTSDDLQVVATQLPTNTAVLFLLANTFRRVEFMDGLLCIGGPMSKIYRLPPIMNSGSDGTATYGPGLVAASNTPMVPITGGIHAGETWYLQAYFRDMGSCANGANTSNAISVTFEP